MSFKQIDHIDIEYDSMLDNVAADFYIPLLEQAKEYKRAVGYFSSTLLTQLSKGIVSFALHGGKIKLMISPNLSEEDYKAIENGYSKREIATKNLIAGFNVDELNEAQKNRLGLLAYLIEKNILEIKIAVMNKDNLENTPHGIFHTKFGIAKDECGDRVGFNGSLNDTYSALKENYEDIDVYCSWKSDDSYERCNRKEAKFNSFWDNHYPKSVLVIPFPDVIKNKMMEFIPQDKTVILNLDKLLKEEVENKKNIKKAQKPNKEGINFRDYQNEAIQNWVDNNYRGIFDMATGTGKTYTGLGALTRLYEDKGKLFAIIVCPYKHLVEQWLEECENGFGFSPIVCHSDSNKWYENLNRDLNKFSIGRINFVCAIITNRSFATEKFQNLIKDYIDNTLVMVDEAHNFAALQISKCMSVDFKYRLGLSATIVRHNDDVGTDMLFNFFGKRCIEYDLETAIANGFLTRYKYYPILVTLTDVENEKYRCLTQQISQCIKEVNGKKELTERGKKLLLQRARLIAGAENKIQKLKEVIGPYKNATNMLIYCGAVRYGEDGYDEALEDKRQIEAVINMLMNTYKMKVSKFTSDESLEERKNIKRAFVNEDINAMVAIKCLDEGMNIPAIKTAFILASSTNPKEYIQRRGRVLRTAKGKEYAEIFDFITVTRDLDDVSLFADQADLNLEKGLALRELNRMMDFASLAMNPSDSNLLRDQIMSAYSLDIVQKEKDDDYE